MGGRVVVLFGQCGCEWIEGRSLNNSETTIFAEKWAFTIFSRSIRVGSSSEYEIEMNRKYLGYFSSNLFHSKSILIAIISHQHRRGDNGGASTGPHPPTDPVQGATVTLSEYRCGSASTTQLYVFSMLRFNVSIGTSGETVLCAKKPTSP